MSEVLIRKAATARLQEAEFRRRIWCYIAEAGTQITDLLQPAFWERVHGQLQPWDRIEVFEEGGAFYAELLVRSSTGEGVIVAGIRATKLEGVAPRHFQPFDAEGLSIVYKGPFLKWCVVTSDDRQLQGGFENESAAAHWLRDHVRVKNAT